MIHRLMDSDVKFTPPEQYSVAQELIEKNSGTYTVWQFQMPRQVEIHLPPYKNPYSKNPEPETKPCIFNCSVCAGKLSDREVRHGWEPKVLNLLNKLAGEIPYTILSGHYTEPTSNPYFPNFLETTKRNNGHFGVHTNGGRLIEMEEQADVLTRILTLPKLSKDDFISISVYGGNLAGFYAHTKTMPEDDYFDRVNNGIALLGKLRLRFGSPLSLRLSYLGSAPNLKPQQAESVVELARNAQFDSLRFSIAFAHYGSSRKVIERMDQWRRDQEPKLLSWLEPLLSTDQSDFPFVFYRPEQLTDSSLYDTITNCWYNFLQVTVSARGTLVKCPTLTMSLDHDLGPLTNNIDEFRTIIAKSQDPMFDPCTSCFNKNQRCDPLAITFNSGLSAVNKQKA